MKFGESLIAVASAILVMVFSTSCQTGVSSSLAARMSGASAIKATPVQAAPESGTAVAENGETKKFRGGATISNPNRPNGSGSLNRQRESGIVLAASHQHQRGRPFPSMVGSNLLVRTTAYCHKEADSLPYGRLNAAGGTLQYGTTIRSAAADWSRFPLGTRFRIQGQPYEYIIDDYGSALVGTNTIDLYKPTFTAMNEWGARRVPIQIIEWGCFHKSREILRSRRHVEGADHVRQMLNDIESRYLTFPATAGMTPSPGGRDERA